MILWIDGAHDPAENMRRDRALLEAAAAGGACRRPAVLRLFQFAPPGITLGRSQDANRALDLALCRRDGVPWAVRPTGGRGIFHAEEWTYSLAAEIDDPAWGGSLAEAYDRVSRLILGALARLGVPAELASRSRAGRTTSGASGMAPCFASTARHEILLAGRKLVGSAQRRRGPGMLQQGSLLLGPGHLRLADYLPLPAEERQAARAALDAASAEAGRWLGEETGLGRWADALLEELPRETQRLEGARGLSLLTLPESPPYTRSTFEAG